MFFQQIQNNINDFKQLIERISSSMERYPGFDEAHYYPEKLVHSIRGEMEIISSGAKTDAKVLEVDSFHCARMMAAEGLENILVLNFANPVSPGGGVTRGAIAQEEDLCRHSTLYFSLLSSEALPYYENHARTMSNYSSDSLILSPHVYIVKDEKNQWLPEPVWVSVLTSAAPICDEDLSDEDTYKKFQGMFQSRISGFLAVAKKLGYTNLVLGAYGCGAFGNDAKMVAQVFKEETEKSGFEKIYYGILPGNNRNAEVFKKIFNSQ